MLVEDPDTRQGVLRPLGCAMAKSLDTTRTTLVVIALLIVPIRRGFLLAAAADARNESIGETPQRLLGTANAISSREKVGGG